MPKLIDLTGQTFNQLTVLKRDSTNTNEGKPKWICQCSCGNIISVSGKDLKNNHTKSCGCLQKKAVQKLHYKDLTGQIFGYLQVLEDSGNRKNGRVLWKCKCLLCNNIKEISTNSLTSGKTVSCGCMTNSIGELNICNILKLNNIEYIQEKSFFNFEETNAPARYDFYLPKYNRLIEYDGIQHFSYKKDKGWNNEQNFLLTQKRDQIKNKWAAAHNIPLVRIPYWERDNITLEMLLGDKYLVG